VKPIVSREHLGVRDVLVNNKWLSSRHWDTFHSFLANYFAQALGRAWAEAEGAKPLEERHPIMQSYEHSRAFIEKHLEATGAHQVRMTGPIKAFASLAYDFYVVANHGLLAPKLLERLRNKDQFQGARYELYVYTAFVRAGFDIEPEDETDSRESHCEFTATDRDTGHKYSVEAKSRHRHGILGHPGTRLPLEEIKGDVHGLLHKALKKSAKHERVVFLDLNMPPIAGVPFEYPPLDVFFDGLKERDEAPPDYWSTAFVCITNQPSHYVGSDEPDPGGMWAISAINNPKFRENDPTLLTRYPILRKLQQSLGVWGNIPHEF
jgi:hypothetical protein